ncbi:DUF1572 domain-containing protein [soil metagenome]
MQDNYLASVKKQFAYYKMLGEKTFDQLTDKQLAWQYNSESNSIAMIVKHLWGNMLSRWTDFLSGDGEKEWRNREAEFENDIHTNVSLLEKWNEGWKCLFVAIDALTDEDLGKEIFIRNIGQSVTEALNRQLAHYSYHVGQVVFTGKMICDENWVSLSIPKGNSNSYNEEKFAMPRHRENFLNEFLNNKEDY